MTTLYKQRPSKNRVSILASLAVLASSLVLPLQQAVAASLTPVVNFNGANGANPRAGVFQATDKNLYGTTSQGGSSFNNGTAFKLTSPSFTTLTTLFSFTGTAPSYKGTNAVARLFQAGDGNFYGVTSTGGANNIGTLFKLASPAFTALTTLVDFSGIIGPSLGSNPEGRLITGSDGNLWGTASTGGVNDLGTVFKIPTTGGTPTIVVTFNGTNGANPSARLQLGSDGNYYGTASAGGASNRGVVFKLTPAGVLTISSFNGANGENPQSGLVEYSGSLYGTTSAGGGSNNQGAIFRIPLGFTSSTAPILVASFNGTNGAQPTAALTPTTTPTNGIFYGTASAGGASGTGVIYQLTATGTPAITPLINFNALASGGITNATGARPQSTLVKVTNADQTIDYYGTASGGGTSGRGNVFKFRP
ncbi:MAG: choice-of-anchor tandem repeat GloVer-containing protein [Nostoc sp.]